MAEAEERCRKIFARFSNPELVQMCGIAGIFNFRTQEPVSPRLLKVMTDTLAKTSRQGTFSEEDFKAYREAWRRPGAPKAMINWYRAALRTTAPAGDPKIEIPVRILWGARDRFLSAELAELSLNFCPKGKLTMFPDATHWLQHEEQAAVSMALTEFFAGRD